jgi:hypothetical protein
MGSFDDDTHKGLPSAAYWRQRAERARHCAQEMRVSEAQQAFLNIAKIYDSMAEHAAEREVGQSWSASRARPQGPEDHGEQA